MILYYFPSAQNAVNKTVIEFFTEIVYKYMYVHIFYHCSIYWSDTGLMLIYPLKGQDPGGGGGGGGGGGEGRGYSNFFRIRRLGPSIYSSPQKNIRNFKHPKKYLKF